MQITWDEWATPTITADSEVESVYGIGYAQAVAVGGDVLELYGFARGEAAKFWGPDYLVEDRMTAQLGLKARTDDWVAQQTPETMEKIEAFCAGFNAACDEDETIGAGRREVLPVVPRDVVAHILRIFVRFNQIDGKMLAFDPKDFYGHVLAQAGSNSWAVAAEKSTTGHAMVMINPHLSWSIKYHRFFEVKTIAPERTFDGTTLIGAPWQSMGHSPDVAWGHTVNPIKNLVVFELKNVEGNDYDWDGGRRTMETVEHKIEVLGAEPELVLERRSVHGQVITAPDGTVVAVRIAGVLNNPAYQALASWWEMSKAKSLEEIFEIHDRKWLPMFNLTGGDSSGSVGALYCGTPPIRADWDEINHRQDGSDPARLIEDVHPASAMPRVVDPECGWVQNCNDTPFIWCEPPLDPADYPTAIAPGLFQVDDIRPLVSRDWLHKHATVSPEELLGLKYSKRAVLADIILDDILAAAAEVPELEEAVKVLSAWGRTVNSADKGYPLFFLWIALNGPLMVERKFWHTNEKPGFLPTGLQDIPTAVAILQGAVATFTMLGLPLDVAIGDIMTLGEGEHAVPADGGSGLVGSLKSYEILPEDGSFVVAVADTYVSRVLFQGEGNAPIAESVLVYGNATEPGAPASQPQHKVWAADQLRPAK